MSYEYADSHKVRNQGALHSMTFDVVGGIDLFCGQIYRDVFLKNMKYCMEHKNLLAGAYVIMSNHVQVIWQSKSGRMSDLLRDFKSYCCKEFISTIEKEKESRKDWLLYMFNYHANRTNQNKDFKIWTGDNHVEEITSQELLLTNLNFIHQSPVRAGLVKRAEDYLYSSASNYVNGEGVFEIDYLF